MGFDWHPKTFQDVVRIVNSPSGLTLNAMAKAIKIMGSLSCPPPSWDPDSTYRVAMGEGGLVIQKFAEDNTWQDADLFPPEEESQEKEE